VIPKFTAVDFVSFYIQIPTMLFMFTVWMLVKRPGFYALEAAHARLPETSAAGEARPPVLKRMWYSDLVDVQTVDLFRDEHIEGEDDKADDQRREARIRGGGVKAFLWRIYYVAA
jgi:AAT family amino acid transporter